MCVRGMLQGLACRGMGQLVPGLAKYLAMLAGVACVLALAFFVKLRIPMPPPDDTCPRFAVLVFL